MRVEDYKLQRYSLTVDSEDYLHSLTTGNVNMKEDDNGEWVKWESVLPLIQAYLSLTNTVSESELMQDEIDRIHRERLRNMLKGTL